MTRQIRTTLLTGLFFFGLLTSLQAQDKYEFATVRQVSNLEIVTSIEGKPHETEKLPKEFRLYTDNSYLFARVAKLQQDGWEVFSVNDVSTGAGLWTTFFLRKKKN